MNAIEFNNVWEKYRIKFIREGKVFWEEMWAIQDGTFTVKKGEVLGIIGQNGAGKTTLLKLIAGMLLPDKGEVNVKGKVSVLMELGAGFNPEFTGKENIILNAKIYGLDEEILKQQLDKIITFAGLGKFIDAPIKYYSQGMYMRLAFALAIFVEPEILLIDDILSVGDEEAQQKCISKIFELKEAGKTIVVVSHDMGMMERLCDTLILLERGKIIYSGQSKKVINRYLESVGDKKGIAVLSKEKIRIIFNNGRLILAYNGSSITKGIGVFSSFYMPGLNHSFSSLDLDWRISNHTEDKIVAEGFNWKGIIAQRWLLEMRDTKLQLDIEIEGEMIKEPHIDIMLDNDYKEWANIEKRCNFPDFIHKTRWQHLGFGCGILGVAPSPASGLPGLIFKFDKNENDSIEFYNTGYEQESRVIRFDLSENHSSIEINLCLSKSEFEDNINHYRQKIAVQQREEQSSQTISNGDISFMADSKNKSLRLYFKDLEIGWINTVFLIKDAKSLNIQRISRNKLIFTLRYGEPLSLSQIWTLACHEGNGLDIKIEYELNKSISMINPALRLTLKSLYKNWSTAYEQGDFTARQYINNISPIRLKYNKVSKIILESANNDFIPNLCFEISNQNHKQILGIYKHKEKEEYINLNFSRLIFKKEGVFQPGKYTYFEGKIILDNYIGLEKGSSLVDNANLSKDNLQYPHKYTYPGRKISLNNYINLEEESSLVDKVNLSKGRLQFSFDQGRGMIFIQEKELTSGLGLYTSLRSSGIWYDSYQADWRLIQSKENRISITGDWPYIPISQSWEIELLNDDLIFWRVEMEVFEEAGLEIQQANLMLSPEYKNWLIPSLAKGGFSDEYTNDYDIYPFRFWLGKTIKDGIVVVSERFPDIFFLSNLQDESFRGVIENTDSLYRARLVQYQKANANNLLPGKYLYFEGLIKIGFKDGEN